MTVKIIKPYQTKPEEFRQEFDKEKITVEIDGEKINVYEKIQAANVDTDLREVMIKYGCKREQGIEFMKKFKDAESFYGDFTILQKNSTGENILDQKNNLEKFWKKLPADLRAALKNNIAIDEKTAKPIIENYFQNKLNKGDNNERTNEPKSSSDSSDTSK